MSQKHSSAVNPGARQLGFAVVSVFVSSPVVFVKSMLRAAIIPPSSGGQSRPVLPNAAFGDEPLTSHIALS